MSAIKTELTNRPPKESRHLSYIQPICIDINSNNTIHLILSKVPTFASFKLQQIDSIPASALATSTQHFKRNWRFVGPISSYSKHVVFQYTNTGDMLRLITVPCSHLELRKILQPRLGAGARCGQCSLVVTSHRMSLDYEAHPTCKAFVINQVHIRSLYQPLNPSSTISPYSPVKGFDYCFHT
jgi:hypothetical protein